MKPILLLLVILITQNVTAQKIINAIQVSAGKSWHGTGDLDGFTVDVMYEHGFSKRLSLSNGLATTIHYGKDNGSNSFFPGSSPDERLMRFTTAGFQLNSLMHFALIAKTDNQLKFGAGAIFRFQSTSLPQIYGFYQNPNTFPEPFYVIYQHGKHNSISAGYCLSLTYLTKVSAKHQLGIKVFFQNDTNSDVITGISLIAGRLLPKLN